MYPYLANKGILDFRLPPYNPSGERMADISWNPSSFVFLFSLPIFLRFYIGLAWELHGEILWEGKMIEWQTKPCMNLHGMYRWFGVVPQGLIVSIPFFLFADFRSLFGRYFVRQIWECFGGRGGWRIGLVLPFSWWSCPHKPHESTRIWSSSSLTLVLDPLQEIFDFTRDAWFEDLSF
jgi:hypothetical protein